MTISGQPMISRETRRLLITVILAITALWVLARIRFQGRPAAITPVPNVLAQLRPASSYEDLARLIADIRPAILAAMSPSAGSAPALRIREEAAVTLRPASGDTIVATDRATGLAIVRRPRADVPGVMPWVPRLLDYPRYLVAADVTGDHVALRPVFVGGLYPAASPLWSGDIWLLPPNTAIPPGTFVFTTEGALAGLGIDHNGRAAIVPAAVLTAAVDRLQQRGPAGELGMTIEPLSPAFASAIGSAAGVVVTAVAPDGPAAGKLVATEVIEAIDGEEIRTPDHWRGRVARVSAGETLTLRVRGAGGVRDVPIVAAAPMASDARVDDADEEIALGLRLRSISGVGAEVLSVQPRSRAARAGIQQGDRITAAGGHPSPTPAHITRLFSSLPQGGSLLVAIARGGEHRVVAIDK